jgi:rubrerythrin
VKNMNRTGLTANPDYAPGMLEVPDLTEPSSTAGDGIPDDLRAPLIKSGEPVGSLPPAPSTKLAALLDKLSDRVAFERGGTRLYEAVLGKLEAGGSFPGGPTREDLTHIRDEEHEHFQLVADAVEELGGDPTMVSPCANLSMVATSGLVKIVTDPRTSVGDCLKALLVAELTDNDEWDELISLARDAGQGEIATRFEEARAHEAEHLARVREWTAAHGKQSANGKVGRKAPSRRR